MADTKRVFVPGDEWLYFKIYSGPKMLEKLLINELKSITASLLDKGLIDSFFYVRYNDTGDHIRLRLHLSDYRWVAEVLGAVNQALRQYVDDRVISNICIDTYKRELERYGPDTINTIERFFFYDSLFVINHLHALARADDGRWLVSLNLIDNIMKEVNFNIGQKAEFCDIMCKNFERELRVDQRNRVKLDEKFRHWRNKIDNVISAEIPEVKLFLANVQAPLKHILESSETSDKKTLRNMLASIFHMHFNRLFRSKARIQEFVMYYFLTKYYNSVIGRSKQLIPK